jgi:hypothetical protein
MPKRNDQLAKLAKVTGKSREQNAQSTVMTP